MLRFCCLGSGSAGNALLVEASERGCVTRVLLDAGFGPRILARRLAVQAGIVPGAIDALVLTHEHSDHVGGVAALLRRWPMPVYASAGTLAAVGVHQALARPLRAGSPQPVGAVELWPFEVPHDAVEPLQMVFSDGQRRLGVATDLGESTPAIERALDRVDGLVLECNHDAALLRDGPYPAFLKARVGGRRGHLSNAQAAALLGRIDRSRLRVVVAAHLSRTNNRPEHARAAVAAALGADPVDVDLADQDAGLGWRVI